MNFLPALHETLDRGGVVVWVIMGLSLLLYTRCFSLLIFLTRARQQLAREFHVRAPTTETLRLRHDDLSETFERQRVVLAAMIAAAPLLGLLGTVTGMIRTFQHLASGGGQKIMGGLADGISEALIATAAGLSVAIPAVLLLYVAHRQLQKIVQLFAQLEAQPLEAR
jgi:biopolymer transport protein ExbB